MSNPTSTINMDVVCKDEVAVEENFNLNLSDFEFKRTLCCNTRKKSICIEATLANRDGSAVSFFEKSALNCSYIKDICNANTTLEKQSSAGNAVHYLCFPKNHRNELKIMLIFPATTKHIQKYESCPAHIIEETPELYREVVLPFITRESFKLQWVYNIFDRVAEKDSIIYEDEHPKTGFLLISDFKWDKKNNDNLHILALARPRNIKSLRDLDDQHLPLLRNIYNKGVQIIQETYGLGKTNLRIFFHYLPSYYHLHIHFTNIEYEAPGIHAGKAHALASVIKNIELIPDYYKRATFSYILRESDGLYKCIKENEKDCSIESNVKNVIV